MRKSTLVQRINKSTGFINPFGNTVGDANKEPFKTFNKEYPMDLMGAAEYEFGSIEKTLSNMWSTDMKLTDFVLMLDEKTGVTIYMWVPQDSNVDDYMDDIESIYEKGKNREDYKEVYKADYGSFYDMIDSGTKDSETYQGWLSLSNNYVFFLCEENAISFGKYINEGDEDVTIEA